MKSKKTELDNNILKLLEEDEKEFYKAMKELEPNMNPSFFYDE